MLEHTHQTEISKKIFVDLPLKCQIFGIIISETLPNYFKSCRGLIVGNDLFSWILLLSPCLGLVVRSGCAQQPGSVAQSGLVCVCLPPCHRGPLWGRGKQGLWVPAQMSSIHFPTSTYGGPLSSATEAEVMQFVGMSCHFHKLSNPLRPGKEQHEGRPSHRIQVARMLCECLCPS